MSIAPGLSSSVVEAMITQEADTQELSLKQARAVMALRRRRLRDGNRRKLFAAFDDQFAGVDPELDTDVEREAAVAEGPVRLRRLQLRNWKVFENLDLQLPAFDAMRSVVLIGGKNGYGKTSILEGLLFGLFGQEAVLELGRSDTSSGTYRTTIQRAYNRRAQHRRDGVASVRSEWDTPNGAFTVERRWYFDDSGALVPEDETLTVFSGEDGSVMPCPADTDTTEFFQQEIYRRLLSPSLAAFVFFDGEQVQRFAETGFNDQVRSALESASGLSSWRSAALDLRDYARDRSRGAPRDGKDNNTAQLERIDLERASLLAGFAGLIEQGSGPEAKRDLLLEEIAGLESGHYAGLHQLLERQQGNRADQAKAKHDLAAAATSVLPAIMMKGLRANLGKTLAQGAAPTVADGARFEDEDTLELLVGALRLENPQAATEAEPLLRSAWARLRDGQSDAATTRAHPYLAFRLLPILRGAIERAPDQALLEAAAERVRMLDAEAQELAQALTQQKRRDERLGAARRELQEVKQDLAAIEVEARIIENRLAQIEAEAAPLRASRATTERNSGDWAVRAKTALEVANTIENLVAGVLPRCFGAVSAAVTEAYQALAHKGLVARIEIDNSGAVHLLDATGADVRTFDASAGESQIFAMALMAAIGALAGQRLPVVIDTPLGRLDPDHRQRILQYFTTRERQTLLMSQPDEVNGSYLAMIEDRIAARFRLEHASPDGGPGGSIVMPGYFGHLAA